MRNTHKRWQLNQAGHTLGSGTLYLPTSGVWFWVSAIVEWNDLATVRGGKRVQEVSMVVFGQLIRAGLENGTVSKSSRVQRMHLRFGGVL